MAALYACSCSACKGDGPHMATDQEAPLFSDDELDAFLQRVYHGAFDDGSYDQGRAATYGKEFSQAIGEGYGKKLGEVDYDTPDAAMLRALEQNVFSFSAAKTRAEIVSLSSAMRNAEGKLRSFSEFRKEAAGITGEFSGPWLRTEYNNAVAAAQMAGQWVNYGEDPEQVLVYKTVKDARVREAHRQLDGIARPMSHRFWDTFYPPNGWNCRCDVSPSTVPGSRGEVPPAALDDVPAMFRVNLAKQGFAFPPDHPYFQA